VRRRASPFVRKPLRRHSGAPAEQANPESSDAGLANSSLDSGSARIQVSFS
jgi:hypothetical protein